MGKGDIKSKRGKIANGSYGVRRKKSSSAVAVAPEKPKPAAKKKTEEKPVAEKVAAKKPAAKKAPAKKAADKK